MIRPPLSKVASAIVLVFALAIARPAAPAVAADIGGVCCADLEERIEELEETTARKGNRHVSVAVSGWVNEAIFWWDDGLHDDAYVATNSLEQSRFRFHGEASINKDWSAGYLLEVGVHGAVSNQITQFDSQGAASKGAVITTSRKNYWYLKSKTYGRVSIGKNGTATYHLIDDADATNTRDFADAQAAAVAVTNFTIVSNGVLNPANLRWKQVLRGFDNGTPGQSARRTVVRYDTPDLHGFTFTAAATSDDFWDAKVTFEKDIHDFKVLATAGYGNSTDDFAPPLGNDTNGTLCGGPTFGFDCEWAGGGATLLHNPTGLYVFGGFGWQRINSLPASIGGVVPDKTSTTWVIQPGIERKWHPIGTTTIFGEIRRDHPGASLSNGASTFGATSTRGAELHFWATGVVQHVDPAEMDLYAIFRHADGEYVAGPTGLLTPIDDFDMLIAGALIKF